MLRNSLLNQLVIWILAPIACVIGFVWFQLNELADRYRLHLEEDIVSEVSRVEREFEQVLDTTGQVTEMLARDTSLLRSIKRKEVDFLYLMGSNAIGSTLADRVTIIDQEGIVLARGHEEFAFNDSMADQPLFLLAAQGKSFSGMVRLDNGVSLLCVEPVVEHGALFRGAVIVSRNIAPSYLERLQSDLDLTISIDKNPAPALAKEEKDLGLIRISRPLAFATLDQSPWILNLSKNYAPQLTQFQDTRIRILLFTLLATAATLCFVYVSVRYLLRPMRSLHSWLIQYRSGSLEVDDLGRNIIGQVHSTNELSAIAYSALTTMQELEQTRRDLKRMHENLEHLVAERTAELSEKTRELENEVREREKAEQRIRGLRNHLQNIFDSMTCVLIGADTGGLISFVNAQAAKTAGLPAGLLRGRPVQEMLSRFALTADEVLDAATLSDSPWQLRRYVSRMDGEPRYLDITTYPFRFGSEAGTIIRIDDVSRQVAMEQEDFKHEKLQAIGSLAGGIAHDFNNMLTAMLGNIELCLLDPALDETTRQLLAKAESACVGAKSLTGQLLTFAQGGEPSRQLLDPARVVREAVDLAVLGQRFSCRLKAAADLWPVKADRGQLQQVIRQLVQNAAQAMEEDSVVDITCRNAGAEDAGRLAQLDPGPFVVIAVSDRGTGIPAEVLSRIFDPYFSTKSDGHGLGLAICYSIVRRHQGLIAVESTSGVGTTFCVYLPAEPGQLTQEAGPVQPAKANGTPLSGIILVMDDDKMVREVAGAMLEMLGHSVLYAEDGVEAVRIYREHLNNGRPVDLVLMDLVVPGGMGGKEAVRDILQLDPRARAIVSSGYSSDPVLANHQEYGFLASLAKPYQMHELARTVDRLLTPGSH